MNIPFPPCPGPPGWQVDWPALDKRYAWVRDLAGCPQDPVHHAEGDVWIHTRLVCEALAALPAWRALPDAERPIVFTAALLHDVAKPECTRIEPDGRVTSRGHSRHGSIRARRLLWEMGAPLVPREQVAALVRHHQVPYYLLEKPDPQRPAIEISQTARCDHLALLAEADVRGRRCADPDHLLENVALFIEYCREQGCLTTPRAFPSDHSRFLYFTRPGRHADVLAHEAFRSGVTVMAGLPGSGKDHWIRHNLPGIPVVSLDAVREELDVAPSAAQGAVLNRAREQAREHLRHGRPFVWNATNLHRPFRAAWIRLFAGYQAHIRIVYLDVPAEVLDRQNRQRSAVVPREVIERMLERWDVPDRTEAHEVDWVERAAEGESPS